MTTRRTQPLLDLDADLGRLLHKDRRPSAHAELQVEVHRIGAGPMSVARLAEANPQHVGLLLLEGVVSREVVVADTISTELLGPGDVVRPWALDSDAPLLQFEIRWTALTESRLAVLDRRFASRLSHWPEVNSVLIDRLNGRAQRLAITQAISQLNRVDRRILALFWHLAERWGRIGSAGVIVPLTLSHRMLGQLVGARRPTVSTAVAKLAEQDELVRRDDGSWVLKGEPTGLPQGEAERVVPIRRRLLGAADDTVEPPASAAAEGRAMVVATTAAGAELRATLARLRNESAEQMDRLRATQGRSEEIRARSLEAAESRRAARDERAARRAGRS